MKNNKLKNLYDALEHPSIIQKTNDVNWIIIYKPENTEKILGISEEGIWVVCSYDTLFTLNDSHSSMYAMWLLEYRLDDIYKNNKKLKLDEIINAELITLSIEIIKFVFENINSSYWLNLSFEWYDQLIIENKTKFKEHLKKLMESNNLTQELRHKAKRRYFEN
jgi:hypothetical protein